LLPADILWNNGIQRFGIAQAESVSLVTLGETRGTILCSD
jgi:hypothetical protein